MGSRLAFHKMCSCEEHCESVKQGSASNLFASCSCRASLGSRPMHVGCKCDAISSPSVTYIPSHWLRRQFLQFSSHLPCEGSVQNQPQFRDICSCRVCLRLVLSLTFNQFMALSRLNRHWALASRASESTWNGEQQVKLLRWKMMPQGQRAQRLQQDLGMWARRFPHLTETRENVSILRFCTKIGKFATLVRNGEG